MIDNVWFPFVQEKNNSKKMLFCFHHAGGTASVYRDWIRWSDQIQVIPIELPGKATRMGEKYAVNMQETAIEIADQIRKIGENAQIWLYGHSMGAILAFNVACALEKKYRTYIRKLIVSGRHAPQDKVEEVYHSSMADKELVSELRRVGGTPEQVLENSEVLQFILPPIRADYRLNESYQYGKEILHCPISAYAGNQDIDAPYKMMKNWKNVTKSGFQIYEEEGSHFFPIELGECYWKKIEADILYKC